MTDLDLQEALAQEVERMCADESIRMLDGEAWRDFHVYRQDKPYKSDGAPDMQEDYIIVILDDEDTDDEGRWVVTVCFAIGICLFDSENQGNMVLANVMNQIYMRFCRMGIVAGKYTLEREAHKTFLQDHYPNFYMSNLITKWRLPEILTEFPRGLI